MKISLRTVTITTNSGGAGTGEDTGEAAPINGLLLRISYKPHASTPLDTGADLVITENSTGATVYAQANIGTAAFTKLPRQLIASIADGADSTTLFDCVPVVDRLTLTIANGGNTKTGTFYLFIAE